MNNLWTISEGEDRWRLLEECFSLPVEKRMSWLVNKLEEKRIEHLGTTDKSGPELAIDLIKRGVKAESLGFKAKKTLTEAPKSDIL